MVHESLSSEFLTLVRDLAAADDVSESETLCAAIMQIPDFEERLLEAICYCSNDVKSQAALAIGALGASARGAFRGVLALLSDDDEAVSSAASRAIERLGPLVEPCVVETMQCDNPYLREGAAKAISYLAHRDALVDALWYLLHDDDWPRYDAIEGLESLGRPARNVVPALLSCPLTDDIHEWFARCAVADICVAAMEELGQMLTNPDSDPRYRELICHVCERAFANVKLPDALLYAAENDPIHEVREHALLHLMQLGRHAVTILTQVVDSAATLPPPIDPELRAAFELHREEVRAGLETLVARPLQMSQLVAVRQRKLKRPPADLHKSLLALLDVCVEWEASTFSLRSLVAPLAAKRSDYGLRPLKVSIGTIRTHLEVLARQCGVDSLFVVTTGRASRFRDGAIDGLKALRPTLERLKRREEEAGKRRENP